MYGKNKIYRGPFCKNIKNKYVGLEDRKTGRRIITIRIYIHIVTICMERIKSIGNILQNKNIWDRRTGR